MHAMPLPRRLREARSQSDDPGFVAWVNALPRVVAAVATRWQLDLGAPFEPGGRCSWVAPADDPSGRDLVVKLGWPHDEAGHEPDALRLWDGFGAVRLHAAEMIGSTCALLLERCRPGTSLETVDDVQQDVVIAGLLHQLWVSPPAGHPFRPLAAMCRGWAAEFEQRLTTPAAAGLDTGLLRAAVAVLRELPGTTTDSVVLCTDLHAGNVLAADRAPWLAIDPKPYIGDPAYDPVQHLLNHDQRLTVDAAGVTGRLAGLLDIDVARLRLWLFARCAQEALDQPELIDIAAELAP